MLGEKPVVMDVAAEYQKGFQLRCEGNYREAKQVLGTVLAQDPAHVEALWQVALIKGFEGDFEGSLVDLQSLVTAHPDSVPIRYDLAMTQMMLGMVDEACANFHEVLRLDPGNQNAQKQVSYCP